MKTYFKGGTALYKALKSIRRFSEDIDLTVEVAGQSASQVKKLLRRSAREYSSLEYADLHGQNISGRGSRTSIYLYNSVFSITPKDQVERHGIIMVEATSFTVSEPFYALEITPVIYDLATDAQKATLTSKYNVTPFFINTKISLNLNFI